LLAKLTAGAAFEAAAAELGMTVAKAEGFSRSSQQFPENVPSAALSAIDTLRQPGDLSAMIALPDDAGGAFVRLVSATPPDAAVLQSALMFREFQQRRMAMQGTRISLLAEWTRREQERAGLVSNQE
jgi:hypothetical protein